MTLQNPQAPPSLSQLSVLVSNYNKCEYLHQFFTVAEDILGLGCELVIVDDGSTDGSNEKISNWAKNRIQVKFIPARHSGSAAVRNLAVNAATRTWILFLDIDDRLNVKKLVKTAEAIFNSTAEIALGTMSTQSQVKISTLPASVSRPTEFSMTRVREGFFHGMAFQRYIYKRTFLVEKSCEFLPTLSLLQEDYFILDDIYFLMHISSIEAEILVLPDSHNFYVYTQHEPSVNSWNKYQRQCSLIPRASGLFLSQISKHECLHDQDFLRAKILEVIQVHLNYLNFLSALTGIRDCAKLYRQEPEFFDFGLSDYRKIFFKFTTILSRSVKNSSFPFRKRFGLTGIQLQFRNRSATKADRWGMN